MRSTRLAALVLFSMMLIQSALADRLTPTTLACSPCIATINVNSTTDAIDAVPGDGACATSGQVCTLRAAIMEGNATGSTYQVHINVPAGVYTLTIPGIHEFASATGSLNPTRSMIITGADPSTTIIQASTTDSSSGIDIIFDLPTGPNAFSVTMNNLTLRYGHAPGTDAGGAITTQQALTLNNCVISNNRAAVGGGIYAVTGGAPFVLNNCVVSGNSASGSSGGGGIFINQTPLLAQNTTISNNTAPTGDGGGMGSNNFSSYTLTNCTISGNSASGKGGGISVGFTAFDASSASLTNCTISGNTASSGGSLITQGGGNTATLTNVTSANNSSGLLPNGTITLYDTILADAAVNCSGTHYSSSGHNLSSDLTCGTYFIAAGDMNGTDPKLNALALNSPGTTMTHALRIGSPAIDAGSGCPATDQRGLSRPQGSACDIGAYEFNLVRADFNGDGKSDVIWRKSNTGEDAMWLMNGLTITSPVLLPTVADTNWKMAGVGDFDGDGKADVIWWHALSGQVVVWLMNGTALNSAGSVATVADTNWKIAGVGDFNGDGKSDVVWRNSATGQIVVWLMNGMSRDSAAIVATVTDLNWNIVGIGDFDGDGKSDLFWRNGSTGQDVVWLMNGTSVGPAGLTNTVANLNYKVVGIGDADGDGKADVFWWNQSTGDVVLWVMNGVTLNSGALITTVSDLGWHVEGVGDFDGDGKADLIWRRLTTGETVVWLMNGLTLKQAALVATVGDLNWSIVAPR